MTVTDEKNNPVPNVWVSIPIFKPDGTDGPSQEVGPTDASGTGKQHITGLPLFDTKNASLTSCPTYAQSHSDNTLSFNASTGTLSYTGATIQEVSYHNMTSTTVNTPTETIIGANVNITGMQFTAGPGGAALFGNATVSISNSSGTYMTYSYNNTQIVTDPSTGNSVLLGNTGSFSLDTSLNSEYINEFSQDLTLIPNPIYSMEISGNLASVTNDYTTNGSILVTTDFLAGGTTVPEPSSLILLLLGAVCTSVFARRRLADS